MEYQIDVSRITARVPHAKCRGLKAMARYHSSSSIVHVTIAVCCL